MFRHFLLIMLAMAIYTACGTKAFALPLSEQDKIDYLLEAIASSDLTFIRNGSDYTGKEASDHLKSKLESAGDRIQTAEDFIVNIASKSYLTGEPYKVRLHNGKEMEAEQWLRGKLAALTQRGHRHRP